MIKHLVSWLKSAYPPEELDARCRRLPPNHNLRHFAKGISNMSHVTGKEHADICRFVLALVIGLPLPGGMSATRLVRAVRALLDFLYLARYPVHTSDTLALLRGFKGYRRGENMIQSGKQLIQVLVRDSLYYFLM